MRPTSTRIRNFTLLCLAIGACFTACRSGNRKAAITGKKAADSAHHATTASFGTDIAFLRSHVETIVLRDTTSTSAIAIVPAWQGRVMTSTMAGDSGYSCGWINYALISSGKKQPRINAYGGEDRLWIGPEGGQHGFFFAPGAPFDLEHWQTPPPLDTEAFTVTSKGKAEVMLEKDMQLTNYKGTVFNMKVRRTITLIARRDIRNYLGTDIHRSVKAVAYHSANSIVNTGKARWDTAGGLPSIWILGMFPASEQTTVVIPVKGSHAGRQVVNHAYFGEVPAERLSVNENLVFFKADARHRSKIGLKQAHCYNYLGSYDPGRRLLTIVQFSMPESPLMYVNSAWEMQSRPYDGDAVNTYNDGPVNSSGLQLGNFYELESSSPALRLRPGAHHEHYHRTIHLTGPEKQLSKITQHLFGITLPLKPARASAPDITAGP